jgi:hypothetical protein
MELCKVLLITQNPAINNGLVTLIAVCTAYVVRQCAITLAVFLLLHLCHVLVLLPCTLHAAGQQQGQLCDISVCQSHLCVA